MGWPLLKNTDGLWANAVFRSTHFAASPDGWHTCPGPHPPAAPGVHVTTWLCWTHTPGVPESDWSQTLPESWAVHSASPAHARGSHCCRSLQNWVAGQFPSSAQGSGDRPPTIGAQLVKTM